MTEEELKIALEQNGSASAVLLKEAFDILNAKISGISAQDPRIVGAVSAAQPATLGTGLIVGGSVVIGGGVAIGERANISNDVLVGTYTSIGASVQIGQDAQIESGVRLGTAVTTSDVDGHIGVKIGNFAIACSSAGLHLRDNTGGLHTITYNE